MIRGIRGVQSGRTFKRARNLACSAPATSSRWPSPFFRPTPAPPSVSPYHQAVRRTFLDAIPRTERRVDKRAYSTVSPLLDPTLAARIRRLLRRHPGLLVIDRSRPSLLRFFAFLAIFILASTASYNLIPSTRHFAQAILRCARLMVAVTGDVIEYKRTFSQEYATVEEKREAYSQCHKNSAVRLLRALEALGGIYIKVRSRVSHRFNGQGSGRLTGADHAYHPFRP